MNNKKYIAMLMLLAVGNVYADSCTFSITKLGQFITGFDRDINTINNQISTVNSDISTAQSKYNKAVKAYNKAQAQYNSENQKLQNLKNQIKAKRAAAIAAQKQAEKLAKEEKAQQQESDVWLRGRIGIVVNKTSNVSYNLQSKAGKILAKIAPGKSVTVKSPLSTFSLEKNGVHGFVEFIPSIHGKVLTEASGGQGILVGLHYYLSFNLQGMNQPGYLYGAPKTVCLSRGCPDGATRAQCIDVSAFVPAKDQIWELDIEIEDIGGGKIYPRISAIKTQTVSLTDLEKGLENLSINEKMVSVTRKNMDMDVSYPSTQGQTAVLWQDVPAS